MRKERRRNIAMYAAGVLLLLVLVTTSIVSGLYARYATSAAAGEASRVAKFAVTGSGFSQTININERMKPGDVLNFTDSGTDPKGAFTITNSSEVTVAYTVTIRNTTKDLPLTLIVAGASETDETTAFNADGYTYTSTLQPNAAAHTFGFKIMWPTDPAANTNVVYSGQKDNIAITVTATQVD